MNQFKYYSFLTGHLYFGFRAKVSPSPTKHLPLTSKHGGKQQHDEMQQCVLR